jgi:hypothetical protein
MRWLDVLFGRGDEGYPFWLLTVRVNILLFVLCAAVVVAWNLAPARLRAALGARADLGSALALTAVAGLLRFLVADNVTALGGIGYSRILLGYGGHFGTAQLYSLLYARTTRDLEHAILFNRLASTATVPLVYALCRRLVPASRAFAVFAALLLCFHPLQLLFSATDGLPISSSFLAVAAYLLLARAVDGTDTPAWLRTVSAAGAATGLALLTQVRYENVLFLVPPVVFVFARRRTLSVRTLAPAAMLFALFISVYATEALSSGPAYQSAAPLTEGLRAATRELFDNPIFGLGPVLIGTAAAIVYRRSHVRWFAPLPVLGLVPLIALAITLERHDYAFGFVPLARIYVNQVLLLLLVSGYGLALLWGSSRRVVRAIAVGCVVWMAALTALFWPNLRARYVEFAEHEFFREALAALPPDVDRVVVPDDDLLFRESHSTIELMTKYRMIAAATGARRIKLVGMTPFLESPTKVECRRGNCLFFRGLPCTGLSPYWFARGPCERLMATRLGPAVREQDVVAGSFLDCSIDRGAARRRLCTPAGTAMRFGLYRIIN